MRKVMDAYFKSLGELEGLAKALEVSIQDLFGEVNKEEDCFKWRLRECGQIADMCAEMLHDARNIRS